MKTAKTVVHYLDTDTFGGCEVMVMQLLAEMDRSRWRPVLFHHDAPGIARLLQKLEEMGVACRLLPRVTGINSLRTFIRELKRSEATLFHAHLNWPLGCRHGLLAARLARVRGIVATAHLYSPLTGVRFSWLKQWLQAATLHRYIAVSQEVKARLCRDLHVPDVKVQVVCNSIQLASFNPGVDDSLRQQLTGGNAVPVIFTPARLHRQKGHAFLLQAAAQVPGAIFVLAGDGPERNALEGLAKELGIQERVRFLGQRQDIPQLLANCDLFVLPSLFEGLPLSVLEAMAAGKPVVATDIGGTNEAVVHGETGLLVAPENPTALAAAIRSLLSDSARAARLGEAGKKRVKACFSADAMVAGVTRVYDALIN